MLQLLRRNLQKIWERSSSGMLSLNCKRLLKQILDNTKFILLNIDQSKWLIYMVNLEKKLKEHFKTLDRDNKISEVEFKSICPIGTRPGIFYDQPKVHKTVINNIPQFRPILSTINTPVYKLAKYLIPILSPLTVNDYTVKNFLLLIKRLLILIIIFSWLA